MFNWFNKPKKILEFDLKPTKANILTGDETYKVSFDGCVIYGVLGYEVITGEERVKNYLRDCVSFITTDDGKLVPIHLIKKVILEVQSKIKTVEV